MNFDITNYAPDDDNYPDESLADIVFGVSQPKSTPRPPTAPNAIAVIGVSQTSVRVVLTAERIVYAGKWRTVPDYFDVKGRDSAYRKEFEVLSHWYTFRQCGVQSVQVFENVKVA